MIKSKQIKEYEFELDYFIDESVVGYLKYEVTYEIVNVTDVYVDDKYRRQGIATELFNYLFNSVKPEKFMLEVNENNLGTINLYKKFGFVTIHVRKNIIRMEMR